MTGRSVVAHPLLPTALQRRTGGPQFPLRPLSNRDAIGARVTLHGEHRIWVDEVRSGSSYNSSNDLRLHFGLGSETKINSIEVRWPSGQTELFEIPGVDLYLELVEAKGKSISHS